MTHRITAEEEKRRDAILARVLALKLFPGGVWEPGRVGIPVRQFLQGKPHVIKWSEAAALCGDLSLELR